MKGTFFLGADNKVKFEVRDMDLTNLAPNEVLVKVKACGVCGTDVHIYNGEEGSAPVNPPVVLGHEYAGIVEKIGSKVTKLKIGDHVAIDPNKYCGECLPCRMGIKQECENLYALGVNTNGGFAEYSRCPESQCFKINDDVDFEIAAMTEPLACVIHGIDRVAIKPGENVVVIGGGPIGLLMVQMAKLSGAGKILLSEPVKIRQDLGLQLGANEVVNPIEESIAEKELKCFGVQGADVVIECVGNVKATEQAIAASGRGGRILLFSVPAVGSSVNLPLMDVYKKELTIFGSLINPDTHQRAVRLIESGKLQIKPLITHRFDLNHLEDAILTQIGTESIKVIVCPEMKQ